MNVWNSVRHYIAPSQENVYRPHLLGRGWLMFFLAFVLAVEGFLMSSLVARQDDTFLTQAPATNVAAVGVLGEMDSTMQSATRQFIRTMSDPGVANALLGSIGGVVLIVVVGTFFIHIDVQPRDALLGGVVVAALAFLCLAANVHFLSGATSTEAAGISALAP